MAGHRRVAFAVAASLIVAGVAEGALAASPSSLALPEPVVLEGTVRGAALRALGARKVDSRLAGAKGEVEVWVKLASPSLAAAHGDNAKTRGGLLTLAERRAHVAALDREHDDLARTAR